MPPSLFFILTGLWGMLAGVVTFGVECLFWLKQGNFPDWTLANLFGWWAMTEFIGFNKVLNSILDGRLSAVIFFTFAAIFGLACFAHQDT